MTDLFPYNTLKVHAQAKRFIELNSPDQKIPTDEPFLFLGLGANILFTKDFDGTIVKINFSGIKVVKETDSEVIIEAAAGQNWHDLVTWSVDHNLSGLENMALIPGTVGAAAVGNIAAYGQNQEDVFESLSALDITTNKSINFFKPDCKFTYRESLFKKNAFLITSVTYRLSKVPHLETSYHATRHASLLPTLQQIAKEPYTIKDVYNAIIKMRTEKLPDWHKVGTAGSFFKNPVITKQKYTKMQSRIPDLLAYPIDKLLYTDPSDQDKYVKLSVARVLDELGWKGKNIGRVSTSPNQALYVINLGGATGQEIFEYAEMMRQDIKKHFDIDLEYEVRII
ncbi:UDP-N-acetylenolpyruvoylglucosamine reductase [Candidatus Amesbacteria bacterium RIFCSPHIGHO2_01_FULL_48_32]|uniref:UDP-N-acetylenolpyruvoylglucosamine reductase n=1 Tax=Candidatus Amesbacteria bacterium RIFCSPLOWO2_01_FULL_48_25 TaxID=1797259 RepID=A0A1F4ZD91_9BACT|nr:MAG: UDP-N-acetylenolpyruvoylglucosamine reductase [Candidatus Amesbacteria bacterium RIFCSPHIGHO2_01_FULL_48_32]OGD04310.1 MAG: UDP-N-acetylenolpyruvoylglucosamine reductase [Candidatus Amesbacteria bacterium RIFCSPLOWO2_01_FULL_48_25]HJZ05511.1 UDP-N-acetylmuramate dehydrogenase [Patescibacteria group bacterium]